VHMPQYPPIKSSSLNLEALKRGFGMLIELLIALCVFCLVYLMVSVFLCCKMWNVLHKHVSCQSEDIYDFKAQSNSDEMRGHGKSRI